MDLFIKNVKDLLGWIFANQTKLLETNNWFKRYVFFKIKSRTFVLRGVSPFSPFSLVIVFANYTCLVFGEEEKLAPPAAAIMIANANAFWWRF